MPGGGACPSLAGSAGVGGTQRGAYPICRLPLLPLACFSAPIPPTPFPAGRGRFWFFLCKGLRPLHPRGWMGRDTGSTCVGGALRGAYPLCRLPLLPLACFSAPSPRPPSPPGKGETFSFLMQGASPLASPGLDGTRHWLDLRLAVPCGGPAWKGL